MDRRLVAVALAMSISLIAVSAPIAAVGAAAAPADAVAGSPASGTDAAVVDRFRTGVATGGPSRADTDGVLEQPTRAAVHEAVAGSPGADLGELAETVGVTKSTVRYHVGVLRDAGLVETAEVGGALRVTPAGTSAELAGTLQADPTGAVLGAVAEREPASVTVIASETDRALSTVSHHLTALEQRGLVDRERHGEAVLTTLSDGARAAMAELEAPACPTDD